MGIAQINPTQDYDIIQTLTFNSTGGSCKIALYRGSVNAYSGTVYVRAGTSGSWSAVSVSGYSTTFPITSTTMQVAHDWNKEGDDYMTCSFQGQSSNLTKIEISQKAVLSGVIGNCFMYDYARNCSNLTRLDAPDISGVTSVGYSFMRDYAYDCSILTSLDVPDTSSITTVGNYFMSFYAYNCSSLTKLILPKVGWFATHNVDWSVPSGRLGLLKGYVIDSADLAGWQSLTVSGKTLFTKYISSSSDVIYEAPPELK